jgi:hypothetical protein
MFGLQISYGDADPNFSGSPAAVGGRKLARAEVLGVPNRSTGTRLQAIGANGAINSNLQHRFPQRYDLSAQALVTLHSPPL